MKMTPRRIIRTKMKRKKMMRREIDEKEVWG